MLLPIGDNLEKNHFPFVTVILMALNVLIFAVMFRAGVTGEFYSYTDESINERIDEFYCLWGLVPKDLASGQVMGLLTNIFLHGDIFHLLGNMIVLWAFGRSLEICMGSVPFAVMYILWGVIASLSQCLVDFSSEIPMMGASGAIAGVMGAYLVMFGYAAKINIIFLLGVFPLRFAVPACAFGGFWILSQLLNASMDPTGDLAGVAWMAHIGGFAVGAVTMLIFKNQTDRVLVHGSHGTMLFQSREELEIEANTVDPRQMYVELEEIEIKEFDCSKCQTVLNEADKIGPRLYRCSNPDCGQLCYMDSQPVQPTAT